jgi:hypothetical protein
MGLPLEYIGAVDPRVEGCREARFIGRNESRGYVCPVGTELEHIPSNDAPTDEEWSCYRSKQTRHYREDGESYEETVYYGKSTPQRVHYQIQITVEPRTAQAYSSPIYRINLATGFVEPAVGRYRKMRVGLGSLGMVCETHPDHPDHVSALSSGANLRVAIEGPPASRVNILHFPPPPLWQAIESAVKPQGLHVS